MEDYPAAHSMDTNWFAVDAEGNIGVFDSGEGGAIPTERAYDIREALKQGWRSPSIENIHELFSEWSKETEGRVIHLNLSASVIIERLNIDWTQFDLNNVLLRERNSIILPIPATIPESQSSNLEDDESGYWEPDTTHWLLRVVREREEELLDILKQRSLKSKDSDYFIRFAGEPPLIFAFDYSTDTLKILFEQGFIRGAVPLEATYYGAAPLLGLFSYSQDSSSPEPYECDGIPLFPLKTNDLPEVLKSWIRSYHFDRIKFSEHPKIQPIEQMRCDTWGNEKWWVDCEGNEREGHPHDR